MRNNLRSHNKMLHRIRQWLPEERVTRQRNLALLVVGLYLGESVYLTKMGSQLHVAAKKLSLATRLRRFLRNAAVCVEAYYEPLLVPLLQAVAGKEVLLILDTTTVGPWHRALVASLAYRRRALPLAWRVHEGTRGNVPVTAQVALLERVYELLPLGTTVTVLGDSGFDNTDLLLWMRAHGWHFVIRQKKRVTVRPLGEDAWFPLEDIPLEPARQTSWAGSGWPRPLPLAPCRSSCIGRKAKTTPGSWSPAKKTPASFSAAIESGPGLRRCTAI